MDLGFQRHFCPSEKGFDCEASEIQVQLVDFVGCCTSIPSPEKLSSTPLQWYQTMCKCPTGPWFQATVVNILQGERIALW